MARWLLLLALSGCAGDEATAPPAAAETVPVAAPEGGLAGVVLETTDAAGYTYARLNTEGGEKWVAGPQTALAVGQSVVVPKATRMEGFTSRTLGRTFDEIWFAESWGGAPAPVAEVPAPAAPAAPVAVPEGVMTVTDVLGAGASLAGQRVTVQGVVVKANNGIMGKNWVHLRPSADAAEDLLVTTQAIASAGDVVQATGTVATDRDFGAGYSYALLVEEAEIRPAR